MRKGRVVLIALVAITVIGFVVMALWNALIPELFHGPVITFWQGLGLLLLSHILFRGIGPRGGMRGGPPWRRREWKARFEEKMASMPPEKREKIRRKMQERWGDDEPFGREPKDAGGQEMGI